VSNSHSLSAEHRRHDRLLVARFAVGDAGFGQDHEAADLVRRCSECAALAADMKAISKSVAKLPAAPRMRDFRLTAEQAAQLQGSRFDRWLRTITGSGWATVRPVAAVALSVGLVMIVVGALPMLGTAPLAPATTFDRQFSAGQPSPEQSSDNRPGQSGPSASPGTAEIHPGAVDLVSSPQAPADANINGAYVQPSPAVEPQPGQSNEFQKGLPGPGAGMRDALLLAGLVVTVLALSALALLYAARRRYYDPLLR
jgi:hypothetical protein